MQKYDPKQIEPKWQAKWEADKIYQASEDPAKPKKYVLEYFPYPSGAAMHVGHVRNYTIGDAIARYNRMRGFNVLHPMGWDAFGLPAENYAIKTGISPRKAVDENTQKFKKQLMQMGFSYDWSREIDSTDPKYYKWTQWFFTLLHKRGLAYQQESLQWWCPVDKTVLANEQVEAGKCWRCGSTVEKKALKQWFFKITEYADRLLADLDDLDWSDAIKAMQRNWIGRSVGAEIDFRVDGSDQAIKVFTTRPDTLFGATFMVLAPEHPMVDLITTDEQREEVGNYVKAAQSKSDIQRQETDRDKTGVFTGAYAINPVNNEKIPIWIADYVLTGYGTGAIMAVPAHDERDVEFAQKFDLPIKPVVMAEYIDTITPTREGAEMIERVVVQTIVKHPNEDKYLLARRISWENKTFSLPMGGIDAGETAAEAAKREVLEESGYCNLGEFKAFGQPYVAEFYHEFKKTNRRATVHTFVTQLKDLEQVKVSEEEQGINEFSWRTADEVAKLVHGEGAQTTFKAFIDGVALIRSGEGVLVNSGGYDGLATSEAREKIVADLAKNGVAEERVNYKMRDWLISRQRYWGAPIPIIHCPKDGAVDVPEAQLPVELPELTKFEPSGDGRSPLANVPEFVNTTCPKCGGPAERETDTMDGFACSSWYFLRFSDPHNSKAAFSKDKAEFWLPVDDYIGGAEHAVMHLLYARFWTKVMYDEGLISFQEPFSTLRNHGMILAPDGSKMSKSKGNTIEPDGLIQKGYGADATRIMELFIGPWDQVAAWSVEGMSGASRFLYRVWALVQEYLVDNSSEPVQNQADLINELKLATNIATKRVTEDLEQLGFNTAIAGLMEFVNGMYKIKTELPFNGASGPWRDAITTLLQLLSPFTPHITEELWGQMGHTDSIHQSSWPRWEESIVNKQRITIAIQVNGKLRGTMDLVTQVNSESEATASASKVPSVEAHLRDREILKTIYVPGKLINFVVK